MGHKLQKRFIFITMLSLLAVLILVEGTINGMNIYQNIQKSETLLKMLSDNEGKFPEETGRPKQDEEKMQREAREEGMPLFRFSPSRETPFETRYFSVKVSQEEYQADVSHIASVSEEEAVTYVRELLEKGKTTGYYKTYRYRITETEEGRLAVLVDCRNDLNMIRNFAFTSILVGLLCILLVLVLVTALSGKAIYPVLESIEKQKQFITDAGHELKTPLAIISADVEVIEMNGGENQWTKSIHNQTDRMGNLIKNLLTLSKLEEMQEAAVTEEFNYGQKVLQLIQNFEILMEGKEIRLHTMIEDELKVKGNPEELCQAVSILLDNAVKYTPRSGEIYISLGRTGKYASFQIYNTCDRVPEGDLDSLFDRFYRGDSSRSRKTGGYGIGLSVARAIVKKHHGTIGASQEEGGIQFQMQIPAKR
mgnify:FL=1